MDNKKRSILKTLTWRTVAFVTTTAIAYYATRNKELAISIGLGDTLIKMSIYYLHERVWNSTEWGRIDRSRLQESTDTLEDTE